MGRILFVVGSGIGNQAETIPALMLAKKKYGDIVDVCNTVPYAHFATKVLFGDLVANVMKVSDVNPSLYAHQIVTYMLYNDPVKGVRSMKRIKPGIKWSEVEYNMKIVEHPYTDEDFSNCGPAMSSIAPAEGVPDILIHNGYNKVKVGNPDKWKAKSYARWPEVVERLRAKGLTVGCIGTDDEVVPNCENLCGTPFTQSVAAIKACKMLLSNDTGTFHVASVLGIPNVPIFTFTSRQKNFDKRFHRTTELVVPDLPCSPCQHTSPRHWLKNRNICKWACRNISVDVVMQAVEKRLT